MILHNWFIDLGVPDDTDDAREEWMYIGGDLVPVDGMNLVDGEAAENARNTVKSYLWRCVMA